MAIFVTYLQPDLLQRMHETEGAYNLCQLTDVQLQIGLGLQDYRCRFAVPSFCDAWHDLLLYCIQRCPCSKLNQSNGMITVVGGKLKRG